MRKILIELQIDWEGYEDVSDELIVEDAIEAKVEGVGWTLLHQPLVVGQIEHFFKFIDEHYSHSSDNYRNELKNSFTEWNLKNCH